MKQGFLDMLLCFRVQQPRGDKGGGQLRLMCLPPRTQSTRLRMCKVLLFKFRRHLCKGSMDEFVSEHWQIHGDNGPGSANIFLTKREGCTGRMLAERSWQCEPSAASSVRKRSRVDILLVLSRSKRVKKIANFKSIFWLENNEVYTYVGS